MNINKQSSKKLWTFNFTTIILASACGCVGSIAGNFALSFLVFEETKSTLAAAITICLKLIPGFLIPILCAPIMDRIPRKPVLVGCDFFASAVYVFAGFWLLKHEFSYIAYLIFSLIISTLGSFDELSYNAIYPMLIPVGEEERGYAVGSMLYPMITVVMMPIAAFLYKTIGVANILIMQGILCSFAAIIESRIKLTEDIREGTNFTISQWWQDIKDAIAYIKNEKGLLSMLLYNSLNNGTSEGKEPLIIAFFSTTPGLGVEMFSFFAVVEFIGRTIGGLLLYKTTTPKEKKYGKCLFVYLFYDVMDAILLWTPYPFMLVNRCICGFLGIQSGTLRYAAIQKYIPDEMRARINSLFSMTYLVFAGTGGLIIGALGDIFPYKYVVTGCALITLIACLLTIVKNKKDVKAVFETDRFEENAENTEDNK